MSTTADYDSIGKLFGEFTKSAAQREIEVRTIMSMVGNVDGLDVLDAACGYGFFANRFYQMGARKVVGIDISETMIELAQGYADTNQRDITYHVRNAAEMEKLGEFDLVNAAWLFNYANSLEQLKAMFKNVANNLKPGCKLVAYTVDPNFSLGEGNFDRYGVNVKTEEVWQQGYKHTAEFVTTPPSPFTFFRWSQSDYEQAIKEAGFSDFYWQKPLLQEQDVANRPEGFWDTFQSNCLQTGLVCIL
ncbi:class I SAM-dependent methyltransferase [Vibrio neptunius]|uniref:Class I SAM-dependent methyltransferase n=1 Tax=Vibrio neptunius TaxID=170651 RepID=A0ABS3A103_9VIBR|nr:class I SAM-dependent methyltransferase [Vibrio neptunius]MBN3492183.1 class I SAM-dependent methyltransferase [Vibrio neptunius]MBN3514680.1 class I SAM-dependent methyltransferase [Vibrio neptunius]MBN3549194.1 class I SAM-dependent methyltransferase [Vibrio neptunius]MBN3576719.1 class I SAM-dependent methyltransferase [Vibrio neptunius]MCH9870383.1 class I SAM-dependent methyltransferase [Vibrio neptunius]